MLGAPISPLHLHRKPVPIRYCGYQPDVWQTIVRAVGEPLSADETDLLSIYRITKKQHGIHLAKTAGEMILGLLFLLEDK